MTAAGGAGGLVRTVARREIRVRLADRAFRISTAVTLLAVVALAVLPAVFGGDPSPWRIGATGDLAEAAATRVLPAMPDDRAPTVRRLDPVTARAAVADGDLDVVLGDDGGLLGDESVDEELAGLLVAGWQQERLVRALVERGSAPAEAERVATTPPAPLRLLDPPDEERDRLIGFAVVGVFLLYSQLLGYGLWIASGVVEEKSSRVVEILLAKVGARQLLVGKVVGIGVIGAAQLAAVVAVGTVAFVATGRFPLPDGTMLSAVGLVGWFLLGYVLYAAVFAVAGALAARSEDLQNTTGPFNLVVTLSFIGAVTAAGDPGGTLARVLTWVPSATVMVLPVRVAAGEVPLWEVVLPIGAVLATTAGLVVLADVVYRRAALRTSGRTRLRDVLRA
jgi:ABC-2 type transport system permease protein